jgi:SAM-dependent methyltransferase
VCCGTGVALQFLRPLCSERLVGIDFSSGMIAEARRKLDSSPRPPVLELMESDALGMSFCEEFDAVTCFGALGHILPADQRLFVRRIRDALRPGGRFVFVTGPPPPLFSPVSIVLRSFNAVMKLRNLLLRPPFVMYYLTFLLPQARRLLEEEGFAVTVQHGALAAPYQRYAIVVATRL